MKSDLRANLYSPMTYPDSPIRSTPSAGELALEDRTALRRVAGLSTELADVSEVEYRQLRLERVVLVGVDVPSVDELDSKTLDNHHALGRAGVTIVEGLWLDGVAAGRYEFVGLPLKLTRSDGSPLRAVLLGG